MLKSALFDNEFHVASGLLFYNFLTNLDFESSEGNYTNDTTAINHWNYLEIYLRTTVFKSINIDFMRRYHCLLC